MGYKLPRWDVSYTVPNKKRPIGYSTKATSDLIVLLSQDGSTIQEVYDKINFDVDGKKVLREYIRRGYGNIVARDWFR